MLICCSEVYFVYAVLDSVSEKFVHIGPLCSLSIEVIHW